LLDIKLGPESGTGAPATVFRMQIQVRYRFRRSQQHRQLQLCVPLVALKGDSCRIKDRDLGRVPTVTADDQ
jgi:hypothetical protein